MLGDYRPPRRGERGGQDPADAGGLEVGSASYDSVPTTRPPAFTAVRTTSLPRLWLRVMAPDLVLVLIFMVNASCPPTKVDGARLRQHGGEENAYAACRETEGEWRPITPG